MLELAGLHKASEPLVVLQTVAHAGVDRFEVGTWFVLRRVEAFHIVGQDMIGADNLGVHNHLVGKVAADNLVDAHIDFHHQIVHLSQEIIEIRNVDKKLSKISQTKSLSKAT